MINRKGVLIIDWKQEAERLIFDEGVSYNKTTEYLMKNHKDFKGLSERKAKDKLRSYIRRTDKYKAKQAENNGENYSKSIQHNADGSTTFEGIVRLLDGEPITPEAIMTAHKLKPNDWEVVTYKTNFWQAQRKGGGTMLLYQSKITVKPKETAITEKSIENYLQNKKFKYDKPLTIPIKYDENGEILEIDLPDLHAGLLAWREETGNDYDLHIMKDYFYKCIYDIIERCKYKKLRKILFVTLGDLLHYDNDEQTTTKGTFQQADGRITKMHDIVLDMLVDGITLLGNIAPVEVVYLPGNHDKITGRMLMKAVEMAFINDNNIVFDMSPNPLKYRHIETILLGFTHGNMPAKHMSSWLPQMAKKEFGLSKFVEVHAGHFHTQKTKEKTVKISIFEQTYIDDGVVVRYLPRISNSSYWEHHEAYPHCDKTMMCFVWNIKTGLREMWFSNII
jgi:hypothetical protein